MLHELHATTYAENGQAARRAIVKQSLFEGIALRRGLCAAGESCNVVAPREDHRIDADTIKICRIHPMEIGKRNCRCTDIFQKKAPALVKTIASFADARQIFNTLCQANSHW